MEIRKHVYYMDGLLLHSKLQTQTGSARSQKPEGPSGEDSPVRKEESFRKERKQR